MGASLRRQHCTVGSEVHACASRANPRRMSAGLSQEEKGKMVMAGALVDPLDGGILVFKDCTTEARAWLT